MCQSESNLSLKFILNLQSRDVCSSVLQYTKQGVQNLCGIIYYERFGYGIIYY
jgi:hypothetical protein